MSHDADLVAALARSAAACREWLRAGCAGDAPRVQIALLAALAESAEPTPTCKTCRHWREPEYRDNHNATTLCKPLDPDTDEPMARGFETRLCKAPHITTFEPPVESNGAALTDASEYYAALATAEDFGCVRHEVAP